MKKQFLYRKNNTVSIRSHSENIEVMNNKSTKYIPAVSFDWLTPMYDPIMQLFMPEKAFKRSLIEQMRIEKNHRVLDLGCGTATLAILIKKAYPDADVVGLDGDQKILEIARTKIENEGMYIVLDKGMAFELPYPDNSFDRVVSSLVFHHLDLENKNGTFKEIFRVLKPGGEMHAGDIGKPHNIIMYLPSLILRHFERTSENIKGLLPEMFRSAGFVQVEETARFMTIIGTLSLYKARKAALK